jgi:hypothetical protein
MELVGPKREFNRITALLCDAQFAHGEFSSSTLADRAFRRVKSDRRRKGRTAIAWAKRFFDSQREQLVALTVRHPRHQ